MIEKTCKGCGEKFRAFPYRKDAKYCNQDCYLTSRFGGGECKQCGNPITKNAYCNAQCRDQYWKENDHIHRENKKVKMWERKKKLIDDLGGKCVECGNSDIRVLDINHIDPSKKLRPKDRQYTTSKRLKMWRQEMGNIELLCANCHRIKTHQEIWKTDNYIN